MNAISKNLNFCGIYMIVNLENNHKYIGSSVNIKRRLEIHRANLRHNNHDNPHLQNAWNKYGEDNFVFNILEKCGKDVRFEREQYYVNIIKPEYNICTEIVQNPPVSEYSRRKHSETRKRLLAEGKIPITNNKPVYVYYKDGSFVGYWESVRKASKALNIHYSSACRCIQGHDFQAKGYRFFTDKQEEVKPFTKPKVRLKRYKDYVVIDTVTGERKTFKGICKVAEYFNTTTQTINIYIGGKHKREGRYMIYKQTAV